MTTPIRSWSDSAAGNNATVAGINFAEGQLPSTVNNSARELMAQVRAWYYPDDAGWIDWGATASIASQTVLKLAGDQTAMAVQGRRLRLRGGSVAARYATILSASFTAETAITLQDADGSLSASMSIVGLAATSPQTASRRLDKLEVSATASVGVLVVPDGSAAAPAIAVGDANSGLYGTSATTSQTRQVAVTVNGNKVAGFSWDGPNGTGQILAGSAAPYNAGAAANGIVSIRDTVGNFVPLAITWASTQPGLQLDHISASAPSSLVVLQTTATASTSFAFLEAYSRGGDREFVLRGDGTGLCDGSWTGGGADFAELREWADGNGSRTDRAGIAVVLTEGGRIRQAQSGEDPVGVVSVRPTVVGGNRLVWPGKYMLDAFGREQLDAEGARIGNPQWREGEAYVPRDLRPEWAAVGLLGFVPVRNDQVVSSRWIKARAVGADVTEWLVR